MKKIFSLFVLITILFTSVLSYAAIDNFFHAAAYDDLDTIQQFLNKGIDINAKDADGATALILAVKNSNYEIARVLLGNGADINVEDGEGRTALTAAFSDEDFFDYDIFVLLMNNGADISTTGIDSTTLLFYAVSDSDCPIELVQLLIKKGADVNVKDDSNLTALILAVSESVSPEIVQLLIKNGADIDAKDDTNSTALIWAASKSDVATARLLIENGADINAKDDTNSTALMWAAVKSIKITHLLLEGGVDINVKDNDNKTALILAIEAKQVDTAKALIDRRAIISDTDDDVTKLLIRSVSEYGSDYPIELVKILIDNGADINAIENPTFYFKLGQIEQNNKKYPKALDYYDKALELNPNLMDVFTAMIRVYVAENSYNTAIEKCNMHLRRKNAPPVVKSIVLNSKANLLLRTNRIEEAKTAFKESISKNPEYMPPYLTLANLYVSERNLNEAIHVYKTLIAIRPEQVSPYSILGGIYEQQGKFDIAETQYLKALKIAPDYVPAMNNLAFLYAEQKKELNKALDLAQQAKERTGENPNIMDTLGWVYYKKEQ